MVSQASRGLASGIFIVGLMLIGFGMIIFALPELFAFLAAAIFFIAGGSCAIAAIKIFLAAKRMDDYDSGYPNEYRKNVHIHHSELDDNDFEDF
jgi:hypothetical protein